MTLIFTAVWWVLLVSMAVSAAVTVVALGIYFYDLLGHSEAEQEGRAAAGAAPMSLAAVRALGNATNSGAPDMDKVRRSMFGPSEDYMLLFDRELAEVVELDARRIRRANRGRVA